MSKPRLLIVEDDEGQCDAYKAALEDDYRLEFTESGKQAWELLFFSGESFDLIIIDIVLSGDIDGLELLRKIRDVNRWLPVIIVTGCSSQERAEFAADRGVAGYIKKFYNVDQLKDKIRNSINFSSTPLNSIAPIALLGCNPQAFHRFTQRALYEIHKKFNARITIEDIAAASRTSKRNLCRIFKKDCGLTIIDYLTRLRVEVAKELLNNPCYTVTIISDLLGYNDSAYFIRAFKKITGISPLQFRHEHASE